LAEETPAKRVRLAPDERRAQLVSLAASAALRRGDLPIALADLAKAAGVSKALVYAYFPTQQDLFNAVLAAEFEAMARAGMVEAARAADLGEAAERCALIYFEHIVERGPAAHLILRDPYMRGQVSAANRAFRDRVAGRLARAARRRLGLPPDEAVAAFNLAVVIPEEAGLLARSGDTDRSVARELVVQLVQSTLGALGAKADAASAQAAEDGAR
jgi:AcrR family transcriptional regulator